MIEAYSMRPIKKAKPFVIGVCGRSCSGKSVVTRELASRYKNHIVRIPCDRFFKIPIPKEVNKTDGWDNHPISIRWDRLICSVRKLKNGEATHIPSKGWTEIFDELVTPKPIILLDGFLIFTNEELVSLIDKKIFIDVSDLNILYRRTLRVNGLPDNGLAGMKYTMEKVIPISKKYEKIQRGRADVIVDGNASKEEIRKEIEDYLIQWRLTI
jgi:uridine kinase